MNNFYHINHLPKLDSFNKIHINYILKPNNYLNKNYIINKIIDLNKDLISLTTSFFGIQPLIYGQKKYNMLDREFVLKLPFKKYTENGRQNFVAYLNHSLIDNRDFLVDNRESINKIKCYQKKLTHMESSNNMIINYFQEVITPKFEISNNYYNIDNSIIFEWQLLPYLKLFVNIVYEKEKKCTIHIEISKVEKQTIIKDHARLINETISNFNNIFNHIYSINA
jgi:hypothetical protein